MQGYGNVNTCVFSSLKKGATCQNGCGRKLAMNFRTHPTSECGRQKPGDALEKFLASYGITKEWYVEFKKEHGLPPTCNCDARQEWLNKTSDAHPSIANIGVKLLSFLTRKTP